MSATYRRLNTVPPPEHDDEDDDAQFRGPNGGWGADYDADYEDFEGDR